MVKMIWFSRIIHLGLKLLKSVLTHMLPTAVCISVDPSPNNVGNSVKTQL